jgi:Na+/H+ antiporter NhaA
MMAEVMAAELRRGARGHRRNADTAAALVLAGSTIAALVWANVGTSYDAFWAVNAGVTLGDIQWGLSLDSWVNNALMAVFFFSVGLDVRRELSIGQLRQRERAVLPVCAALGGLIVPAVIFLLLNAGREGAAAWGAVISTDTAFAVGMLALVGPKNVPRLRVFLLTLAVVDDIGALSVIAFFYTEHLNLLALAGAGLGLFGIWLLQRANVWRVTPYLITGSATWFALFASGVHSTLAGVLVALLIPVYSTRPRDVESASMVVHLFRQAPRPRMARVARSIIDRSVPMNQRLSDLLPPYVNFVVVPLFALANAGVHLTERMLAASLTSTLTWGIVAGLVLGKLIGITAASRIVLRLLPGARAPGLDQPRIWGIGSLSGMGFTISLLVVSIALPNHDLQDEARVGVLLASALALLLAWVVFKVGERVRPLPPPAGRTLQRPVDPTRDHVRGHPTAPASIVVYGSMSLLYRRITSEVLTEVAQKLGDRLQVVFRHHAVTDEEVTSALALEAADAQGQFWDMHDELTSSRRPADAELNLPELARRVGLDVDRFVHDLDTGAHLARVQDDNLDAEAAELPERPQLYLDGRRFDGPPNSFNITTVLLQNLKARSSRP